MRSRNAHAHTVAAFGTFVSVVVFSLFTCFAGSASATTTTLFGQSVTPDVPVALNPGVSGSLAALMRSPDAVAEDAAGDLFIANIAGSVTVIAASGTTSLFGQSVTPGTPVDLLTGSLNSLLSGPYGIAVDGAGDLFLANDGNNTVVVVPAPTATSVYGQSVTPDTPVVLLSSSLSPLLSSAGAMSLDAQGDLFIGNDGTNSMTVVPAAGTTSLYGQSVTPDVPVVLSALNGVASPMGIAFDSAGDVFVAGEISGTITVMASSTTTLFGQSFVADTPTALNPGTSGSLQSLTGSGSMGIAFDGSGDLYMEVNSDQVIVVPAAGATVLYGQSVTPDTPAVLLASGLSPLLGGPMGVMVDAAGNLIAANYINDVIAVVPADVPAGPLTFTSGAFASTSVGGTSHLTVTVTNSGAISLTPSTITTTGSGVSVSGGSCADLTAILSSGSCTVTLAWTPGSAGALSGSLVVTYGGGTNPSDSLTLSGSTAGGGPVVITYVAPVTNLSATLSSGTLNASWSASATATSYTCTLLDGTNSPTTNVVTTTGTTCSFSGLSTTGTYGVSVVATNGHVSSTAVDADAPSPPPTTPPVTPPPTKKPAAPFQVRVYFATNSTRLTRAAKASLAAFATRSERRGVTRVTIVGFADEAGNQTANVALSMNRARTVGTYLKVRFSKLGMSVSLAEQAGGVMTTSSNAAKDRVAVVRS